MLTVVTFFNPTGLRVRHLRECDGGGSSSGETQRNDRRGEEDRGEEGLPACTSNPCSPAAEVINSVFSVQVNNATARVVTKKPQTPIVSGEVPGKTRGNTLGHIFEHLGEVADISSD